MNHPHLASLLVLVGVLVAREASATQTVIDNFESPTSPAPWTFSNGPEFPGATGSLTLGAGETGKGAVLAYDFSGGGSYVAMVRTLATPLAITAVGYSARVSFVRTVLRVTDSTNQTFQYDLSRPLENSAPTDWYHQIVDLSGPGSHFGGANDGVIHQPVKGIAILADDSLHSGSVGSIGIDNVVAWDALPAALDLTEMPVPAPAGSADLTSRLGVNIHFDSDNQALDIIAAAGMSRVRMDLGWSGVETTKGTYDFSSVDTLVAGLATRHLKLHLILDYFNPLYAGPPAPDAGAAAGAAYLDETVPAFAALSKAVAAHLAGNGVTYEVWNEENGDFWPIGASVPNAKQYAALCAASIAAVHEGDPTALVSTGGLSGFDPNFLAAMLDAGAGAGANAIGVHPYRQGGAESASDDLATMRAMVASALPENPPVWDTEWGYTSVWYASADAGTNGGSPGPRMTQAKLVSRELLSAWALGFPMEIYYDIRDDGTDPTYTEDNFGLIQNDYTDKPAIVAVRTLTSAAKGRSFTGFFTVGFTSLHAMLLVGAQDRVVVLWNDAPGSVAEVSTPEPTVATDMLGNTLTLTHDGGASFVALAESSGPVYLTFPPAVVDAGARSDAATVADGSTTGTKDGSTTPPPRDAGDRKDATTGASGPSARGCGCRLAPRAGDSKALVPIAGVLMMVIRRRRRSRAHDAPAA